jgi:hypothetical protein
MTYAQRMAALALAGVLAVGVTASGCATPWFGTPSSHATGAARTSPQTDLKLATVTYINGLCKLPNEQRNPLLRELNESLLPNHAVISCGRGGEQ